MRYMADEYEQEQGPNMTLIYMALIVTGAVSGSAYYYY